MFSLYLLRHDNRLKLLTSSKNAEQQGNAEESLSYLERLHAVNVSLYSNENGELLPHLSVLDSLSKLGAYHYKHVR